MKLVRKNSVASSSKRKFALKAVPAAPKKSNRDNGLSEYSDQYRPLTESSKFQTRQFETVNGSPCRDHLEVSVKRLGGNDEENPVCVFLQMWKESERYTGPAKGRTVYFPVEHIDEFVEALLKQKEQCEKQGLENEQYDYEAAEE